MQTLAGFVHRRRQGFEADRRVDQIVQDGLARGGVADEIGVDRLSERFDDRSASECVTAWGVEVDTARV